VAHDHTHEHGHDHDHEEGEEREELTDEQSREYLRRLALAQIRQYPDVALRMQAREVTEFDDYLVQLVERMQLLMRDAQGIGLAATQLGVLQRVFVFEPDEKGPRTVVNPRLEVIGPDRATDEEGCLSLWEVRVPVERATHVVVEGKDPAGNDVRYDLEGLAARAVQHEIDHLDGVLIIDRTDTEHRKQALAKLRPQPVLR
jgi:peptide deformylase